MEEEKVEKIDIDENKNYNQNEVVKKDEKSNEIIMKEKVDNILKDLDTINYKKNKKNKRKSIILTIGIILEIIIIMFIVLTRYMNKKEVYVKEYSCSSTELTNDYSIKNVNKYYLDKNNNVAKTVDSFTYIFNTQEKYNEFKANYVSTKIKNFDGITQESIFDDKILAFKTETTYVYSKLKKNKKVTVKGNELIINIPNRETITLYIENYNVIKNINESMGFVCK